MDHDILRELKETRADMVNLGRAILGLLIIFLVITFYPTGERSIAYSYKCSAPLTAGQCRGTSTTWSTVKYRILLDQQIVVGESFFPQKFTNCGIVDVNNWTCQYDDLSGRFGFTDGNYFEIDSAGNPVDPSLYYASGWWAQWRWQVMHWFR